jgi:protein-S-isoprenylcysteine O-methyltransferase Ste14
MTLAPDQMPVLALWVLWCVLHSLLAARRSEAAAGRLLGGRRGAYRLLYNLFAAASLLPLWLVSRAVDSAPLWRWEGGLAVVPAALLAGAGALFAAGARGYRLSRLVGLEQLRAGTRAVLLSEREGLSDSGVHGAIRHPWYAGALLLVWVREVGALGLAVNLTLSLYLLIGARLEERRLLAELGPVYGAYRQRVSMFFPWKWLARRVGRRPASRGR